VQFPQPAVRPSALRRSEFNGVDDFVRNSGQNTSGLTVRPVTGLPLFHAGDDLATAIAQALIAADFPLQDGDVLVVAQKAVSKVEGRTVRLSSVTARPEAHDIARRSDKDPAVAELMLQEAIEVMRVAPGVVITRRHGGHVLANAGIDASNVGSEDGDEAVLLWPVDPDASARALRQAMKARFGAEVAVVISDSLGRAWRIGTTGHAIGVAGMKPLRDRRGETDLFGRELKATIIGVADEIAAAASLVIGEAAEGVPAAVVRGATYIADPEAGVGEMIRPVEQDLFR
jgi:coenzyme F420-0:L-glutamate ligase/coenzyme F420-1:gamma-L-glutamate ligase